MNRNSLMLRVQPVYLRLKLTKEALIERADKTLVPTTFSRNIPSRICQAGQPAESARHDLHLSCGPMRSYFEVLVSD